MINHLKSDGFLVSPSWKTFRTSNAGINQISQDSGFPNTDKNLINDIRYLMDGGTIRNTEDIERIISTDVDRNHIGVASSNGSYFTTRRCSYDDKDAANNNLIDDTYNTAATDRKLLENIKTNNVPGNSPTEKATNFLKTLAHSNAQNGNDIESLNTSEIEEVNSLMEMAKDSDEDMLKLILGELVKEEEGGEEQDGAIALPGSKPGQQSSDKLDKILTINDQHFGLNALKALNEVSRRLDKISNLDTKKEVEFEPDDLGHRVEGTKIQGFHEFNKFRDVDKAMYLRYPHLNKFDVINRHLNRTRYGKNKDKKQLIFLLVDSSGSMDDGYRYPRAVGVILNRLKAVVDGEAEVWYQLFNTELVGDLFRVHDRVKAQNAARELICSPNFSGGGTCIQAAIEGAIEHIQEIQKERPDLCYPDIMLVSDGDDSSIDLSLKDLKGIRLHVAFVAGEANSLLRNLVTQSGGTTIMLGNSGADFSYIR